MVRKSVRLALASWKQPSSSQLNKHELFEDCDDTSLIDNLGVVPVRPPTPIQEEEEAEDRMGSGMVRKSESMPDLSALKSKMKKRKSLKQIKALVGLDLSPPKDAWFRRGSKVLSSSSSGNNVVRPLPLISPTPSLSASDLSGDSFNSGLDLVSREDDIGEGTSDTINTSDGENDSEDNSEEKGTRTSKRDSQGKRRTRRASSSDHYPDTKKNPSLKSGHRRKRRSSDDKPIPSRSSSMPSNSFHEDDDKQGSDKKESHAARSSKINSSNKERGSRGSTHHKDKDTSIRSARSSGNHKEMSSRSKRRSSTNDMLAGTSIRSSRTTGGCGSDSNKDSNSSDEKPRDESTRSSRTTGADSVEKPSTSAPSSSTTMKDSISRKKEGSIRSRRRSSTSDMLLKESIRSSRTTGVAVKDPSVASGRDESTRSNRTTGLDSTASDEKPAASSSVSRKEPSTRAHRTKRDRSRSKSRREPSRRGGTSTRASRTSLATAAKEASVRSSRTTGAYSSTTKEPSSRSNRRSLDQRSSNEASIRSSRTAGTKEHSKRSSRTTKDRSLLSQSVNESSTRRERTVLSQSLTDNNSTRRKERSSMSQSLRETSTRASRTHQQPNRVLEEEEHGLTRPALTADQSNMHADDADTKLNGSSTARKNLAKDEGTNRNRRSLSRRNRRQTKSPSAHRRSKRASFSETLNITSKKDITDVAAPKALTTSKSTPSLVPARPRIAPGEAEALASLRANKRDTNSVWKPSGGSLNGKKDSVMDNGVKFYSGNNDSLIEQIMSQSSHTRSSTGTPNSKGCRSNKSSIPNEFANAGEGSLSDMVMEFMEIDKPSSSSGNGSTKPEFRVSFHYDNKIDGSIHTMDTSLHNSVGSNISGAASGSSKPSSQTKSNRRKQMSRPNSGRDTWGRLSYNSLLGDVVT